MTTASPAPDDAVDRDRPDASGPDGFGPDEFGADDACAAELLCDRHPADGVAFTVVGPDRHPEDVSFGDLAQRSDRVAAALASRGVARGDAVGVLMGKSADLPAVLLGIWRLGAVHVPLFTAFAGPAVELRLAASGAAVVVADADQVGKLRTDADRLIVQVGGERPEDPTRLRLADLLAGESAPSPTPARVGGDGVLVLLFTSGTTGTPKGVPVPLRAVSAMRRYLVDALDLRDDDVYWNVADPGWAYGLYYGVLAPMALGRPNVLLHAPFSAPLTWELLRDLGVTDLAAAPTVYRALQAGRPDGDHGVRLRCASSAGEPLTPDVVRWSREDLGIEVRDHYGQTELGMVVANAWRPDLRREVVPGSMGHPLPGWTCVVLAEDRDEVVPADTVGRLAVDTARSPLMWFPGYADAPERTAERYSADGRWYLTGDTASQAADGRLAFSSRDDDVIIMAGYRIGPFDVESVLVTHPDVADAAVVAAPDALRGEVLQAFVVLDPAAGVRADLEAELQQLVKTGFAAHAYPRAVHVVPELPRTPSGKVQRFRLREQLRAQTSG
ncbi:AMP-binding protein [Actinomycetospora atypica]|uniref:AMP-binding protein n=1 Tax=Actinomycetospora atypica TaxID=1290095 RepID=A0ABV9YNG9_9PSEU